MNKRIEELVVQASEYVNTVYTPPVRSKTGGRGFGKTAGKMWEDGHVGWHSQFNQKFAELIIKECVEQIIAEGTDWVDFAPSQTGVRPEYWAMAQKIKEHFRVES